MDANGIADSTIQVDDADALLGDIHKPRGQKWKLNDHFTISDLFSKRDRERRGGVKNTPKNDHVVYRRPLDERK